MTPERLKVARWIAWIVAAFGGLFLLVGYFIARPQFFRAYWMAWVFWGGISLGAVAMLMMQALTGGRWSALLRRPVEAAASTLPLVPFLMLPAAFGFEEIFPWAAPGYFAGHARPHHQAYLTETWFWLRAAVYFVLLIPFAFFVRTYTRAAELQPAGGNRSILLALGGVGAVVYVICINFASTDWVMSLEPDWHSTIFAIIFMVSQFLSALALCSVIPLLSPTIKEPALLRDIGNLLLAFVVFWAYVSFSQFLIIWSGNLPREISWYVHRRDGGWPVVALLLGLGQFLLPFALLLSRATKHRPRLLASIAGFILAANALHIYWLIAPSYHPQSAAPHWLDVFAFITVGGIWMASYFRKLEAAYV